MSLAQRRLTHQYRAGRWLFTTWHLHGIVRPGRFAPSRKATAGEAFVCMDRQLDDARTGSLYLRQPEIAKVVVEGLHYGVVMGRYDLGAFVVMANHVHALLLPRVDPSVIMKSLKGFTARRANRLLGCTGQPFWQAESYDHWVRDEVEYGRIEQYIENNPVKAGLVQRAEEFPWSSAGERVGREIR